MTTIVNGCTSWMPIGGVADLSFADLLLILQNGEGKYIIAEQCRPSTVMSLRAEDVVGNVVPESLCAELDAAMDSESVFRSSKLRTVGKAKVCNVYAPVRHNGKMLGLVVRETIMATRESTAVMSPKASAPANSCMR